MNTDLLKELAEQYHDGLIDDTRWAALLEQHGADLQQAYELTIAISTGVSSLPTSRLPDALQQRILDNLQQTTIQSAPQPTATPTIRRPSWAWWLSGPAMLAAAITIFVLLEQGPATPLADPESSTFANMTEAETSKPASQPAKPIAPLAPATTGTFESTIAFELDSAVNPTEPKDSAPAKRQKQTENEAAIARRVTPEAMVMATDTLAETEVAAASVAPLANAPAAALTSDSRPSVPDAARISDADFAELAQQAERYQAERADKRKTKEVQQRTAQVATAVELFNDNGKLSLLLVILNTHVTDLPTITGHMELQGLNADKRPTWKSTIKVPQNNGIRANERLTWTVDLVDRFAPPADVRHMRLVFAGGTSELIDLP